MKLYIQKKRIWILLIYVIFFCICVAVSVGAPERYKANCIILAAAYIITGGVSAYFYASGRVKLFDPFTIVSFLYMMLMIIYPIYDYSRLNLTKAGVNTSDGCIKATIIFVPSYLALCLGYFSTKKSKKKNRIVNRIEQLSNTDMCLVGFVCWLIAFLGCMGGQISRGFSWRYILSLGSVVQEDIMVTSSSGGLLFLLMLAPTMIVSQMMILIYGKRFLVKCVTLMLSMIYLFMRGSRILMLVMIAAPIVYWYTRRKKSPTIKVIIVSVLALLTLFATLQIARVNIAQGQNFRDSVAKQLFSLDTYMSVFESDFSTYKVFYGIVTAIPEKMDYLLGKGLFGYTLALVIPRAIWPGKPDAPERAVVYAAMGQRAVDGGNAYPNLGTFYSEFGIMGCLICMWIYGKLIAKSRSLYLAGEKSSNILYACLWPFFFQLTARSISNAVYSLFFGLLPMIAAWFYSCIVKKQYGGET